MSWILESSNRNVKQLAYQLQVAKDRDFEIIMFDSQKVETDQSLHIPINSFSYRAETRYFYRIKVWDNYGEESSWSEVAFWETGLQGQDNWSGNWIAVKKNERKLCPLIKILLLKK